MFSRFHSDMKSALLGYLVGIGLFSVTVTFACPNNSQGDFVEPYWEGTAFVIPDNECVAYYSVPFCGGYACSNPCGYSDAWYCTDWFPYEIAAYARSCGCGSATCA